MKPLDKLTELLCENERVNEDIKELKLGCKIKYKVSQGHYITTRYINGKVGTNILNVEHHYNYFNPIKIKTEQITEIIGNPLLERHLRMYCEDTFHNEYLILKGGAIYFNNDGYEEYSGITLDNTKDLYEQSDSVIERILDFLKK